jgi:hypothetical protein
MRAAILGASLQMQMCVLEGSDYFTLLKCSNTSSSSDGDCFSVANACEYVQQFHTVAYTQYAQLHTLVFSSKSTLIKRITHALRSAA